MRLWLQLSCLMLQASLVSDRLQESGKSRFVGSVSTPGDDNTDETLSLVVLFDEDSTLSFEPAAVEFHQRATTAVRDVLFAGAKKVRKTL